MLFNSTAFLFFLPAVFLLYWFVCNRSVFSQNILILVASYFFYGWWSWKFMGLLLLSTVMDYVYGFGVASTDQRKARFFLWLSIINNLGILALFKYYDFFASSLQSGLQQLGIQADMPLLNLTLPIGISFYTFHGMSYVFDIYRKKQIPVTGFADYAVFVSFFPLLVAGPIERAHHLLPQVQRGRQFSYSQALSGCRLMLWGLFKKVVIADNLGVIADIAFEQYDSFNGISLLLGVLAFSFQIYGDFSGYSDMALGIARLFGFELLSNFRFPYFSRNLGEFWRRWHISLSGWFRDYLYIPLGGSRRGSLITWRNTLVVFLVSGLWHGASWNFIVWGGLHAAGFLMLMVLPGKASDYNDVVAANSRFPKFGELTGMLFTFSFVAFAWVFFRAPDLAVAVKYLENMLRSLLFNPAANLHQIYGKSALFYILPLVMADWHFRHDERELKVPGKSRWVRWLFYALLIFLIGMFKYADSSRFIYFQF
jgi:alginate O-acetyltransferase complex protein AlgI